MLTVELTRLRELVEKGAGSSLTARQMSWTQVPEKAASERKGAHSTEGQRTGHLQDPEGGSTFEARMQDRGTPPGVCDFAWRGDVFRRVNSLFSYLPATGTAPSVA